MAKPASGTLLAVNSLTASLVFAWAFNEGSRQPL